MKRKVEELLTLYNLEPEIKDLYVEGVTDKSLFLYFFESLEMDNIGVYSIDTVDFSTFYHDKPELEKNYRNQLIFLASLLTFEKSIVSKIGFVIDLDYFQIDQDVDVNNRYLYPTDYSCIESYMFDIKLLSKFFNLFLHGFPISAKRVLREISSPLKDLYTIRYISRKYNLTQIDFTKLITIEKKTGKLYFDEQLYIDRLLMKNNKRVIFKSFNSEFLKIKNILNEDIRFNVNGHDIIALLYWYIKKIKSAHFLKEQGFQRSVFSCFESKQLIQHSLFISLSNDFQ